MANWKVSIYHKKSCEEHEHYVKDGMTIIRKIGWRWASFYVETSDNNPPDFEFEVMPHGTDDKDSINMYDTCGSNIENVELEGMTDGCWEEYIWPEEIDEEVQQRLEELIAEEGAYEILEGQEGWMLDETEAWCWGPLLIEDEDGNQVKIVIADQDGNTVDFKEE